MLPFNQSMNFVEKRWEFLDLINHDPLRTPALFPQLSGATQKTTEHIRIRKIKEENLRELPLNPPVFAGCPGPKEKHTFSFQKGAAGFGLF